jgi:thiamine-phosphate pyrophosphorylase
MPGLYLVTDRRCCGERGVIEVVRQAVSGGVSAVQFRDKELAAREFISQAQQLKDLLQESNVPLIINDRIDVALAIGAAGVHIGQSDMPFPLARKLLGKKAIIGLSIESLAQLEEAQAWDVSYLGVSPVFDTPTKTDVGKAWGLDGLARAKQNSRHPLVAIGGINKSNARSVLEAGADGIAVVSAICCAPNPHDSAMELSGIIRSYRSCSTTLASARNPIT